MPDYTNWRGGSSTRRRFIQAGAAGSALLLAGCGGGDGDDTTEPEDGAGDGDGDGDGTTGGDGDGDGDGGTDRADAQFRVFDPLTSGATPTQRHFNPWNPSNTGAWHPGAAVFDRLAVYSPTENESYPLIAESWEMTDATTLEAEISDEWTWHNGDQFVAQDYVMEQQIELEIARYNAEEGERADQVMESIEAPDDGLVRVNLHDELSEVFAVQNTIASFHGNLGRGIFTRSGDDQWSEWHQQLRDNSGDDKEEVISEITNEAYPMINDDNAIGNGPFQIAEVGDSEIVMEVYEDHPNADNINFERFSLNLFQGSNQPVQPYANNEVDAAHKGFPVQDDVRSQMPDQHTLFREGRSSNKLFAFNCGHDVSGDDRPTYDRNVRKAIAHVFDREQATGLLQGVNRPFEWPACRVPGKVMNEESHEIASFVKENLTQYGTNDTERATELLEEADYEQQDGEWYTPDGDRMELSFMNGTERQDFTVLRQNLEDFGIAVEQQQVDDPTFDERRNNGEYDIMPDGSSANGVTALWALGLVPDWIQSITHFEPTTEIPMPIGDPQGENGTMEINVEDHIRQWQSTGESKWHRELVWWWNQYLPEHENMFQPDAGAYNAADWNLDVRAGIQDGVDDALYIAPKMADGTLEYTGN